MTTITLPINAEKEFEIAIKYNGRLDALENPGKITLKFEDREDYLKWIKEVQDSKK